MPRLRVKPLDTSSWPDFARLVERHNGVWGGCWCMAFHAEGVGRGPTCVGWCQFGPTDELPRIKHRRAYLDGVGALPDWRITCFFVDKGHRRGGVASAALEGALREIARRGGGTAESYPEDVDGRPVASSFLHNGTVSMFERHGFERTRRLGKHHWVVAKAVPRARKQATASAAARTAPAGQ